MRTFLPRVSRRDLLFATLSVAITVTVITGFLVENRWGYADPPPRIIYVESWEADRSVADAARVQRRDEARRQVAIAEFELQRAETLLRRASTPTEETGARSAIEAQRAAIARWTREAEEAERALAAAQPAEAAPPPGP